MEFICMKNSSEIVFITVVFQVADCYDELLFIVLIVVVCF
jgi:hypothetical protein